jgi:hypothetical protein
MPLFGKKDSGKKVRKDPKDIEKQIINIEDKYHLRQVLGKWVLPPHCNRHHQLMGGSIIQLKWLPKKYIFDFSLALSLPHTLALKRFSLKPNCYHKSSIYVLTYIFLHRNRFFIFIFVYKSLWAVPFESQSIEKYLGGNRIKLLAWKALPLIFEEIRV